MRNKNCKKKYKTRIKKHLILGIIFVIMLIIIKVVLIPKLKKLESRYNPRITIEHKIDNKNLYIKINIKNHNIKDLGKANIEVFLDNKLIENNVIYIDKINYTLYTNVAYKNENLLNIMLINKRGDKAYFSKRLDLGG
ncbi:hypothetical protein bmLB2001_000149 [Borrelia miyamotoi]|uniref:Uncharacterized protein n=2 Tax=Borrelia miyamotoi TaxID=47466 RepID=A0AAQ2WVD0_9SPIR|nr:hypothetical protein [Borrelia miyamotoi]AGT27151.1 hypothetical protein I871_00835 [Borrelia miyamotoi LB-2001]AJA58350.1 hypothetical protein RJ61_00750 [Borrelia miyamotoi]AOW95428.1 hypothetical protein AXH25_00760 [Borrelia miyamotoi]QTL83311.1 hypothetical protein bmLB2001_000149 [Borrelia miyamotoi]WAZ85397.1 hypothetical protein O5400_03520 [Borrelia miyamotoi]